MRKTGTRKTIKKNKFSIDNFGKVASSFGYERNTLGGVVEPSIHKEAYMDTTTTPAQFYSPELTPETWLLPKSRSEILKWVRVFFNLEPYIQSILVMHAQYPICDFTLQYKDKDTTDFFNRKLFNNPEFSWIDFLEQLSLSYWKFGEAIVWGDWNPVKGTWNNFVLIDPSLVEYQENPLTGKIVMELIPTTELKQIVATSLKEGRSDLPSEYIECVQENQQIPLDAEGTEPNYITGKKYSPPKAFMFVRKTDPGAVRGTPILQSLFKCVTGDTKVALLDGTNPTIKELAESGKKDFWVYGADKSGNIVPAKAECAAYIKDEETVEVELDNGSKIRCTLDHPFFLRDMTKVEAKDLKPGDSLMPLYRKDDYLGKYGTRKSKYEKIYNPGTGTWKWTHVMSALSENKESFKLKGSRVIHHKNFNSHDNTPENLEVISRDIHAKIHREHSCSRERMVELSKLAAIKRTSDDSFSNKMKEHWADEEYRKKCISSRKNTYSSRTLEDKESIVSNIKKSLYESWKPKKELLAEKIKLESEKFYNNNNRKPSFSELSKLCGVSIGTLTNYGKEFGYDYLGINSKREYKNHTVVSVTRTGKVEPVYCVANAGENHNFMICLDDGSGILSGNTLIYQDKIRLAQIAIADRFHLPLEIWSIGSYTGDPKTSLIPDDATLSEFRNLIQQATMQPPFSIYVPPYVKYEAVGVNGKLLSVYEDLGYVENQILVGLGVNKNLITGQGPSFSSAKQVSLYKLIKMYKIFREKLEAFIKRYILLPISRANDLKDEYGNYIIPDIVWSESLQPEQDKEIFDSLSKLWDKGIISTLTLMENFMKPLDYKLEQKRLNEERGTVFDKGNDRLGNKAKREDLKTDLGKPSSSGDRATADGGGYEGSENDDKSYLEPPLSGGEETPEVPSEAPETEAPEQV